MGVATLCDITFHECIMFEIFVHLLPSEAIRGSLISGCMYKYPVVNKCAIITTASMRLCMGSRRGFIIRMKIGNMPCDPMTSSHTVRVRSRNTLGTSPDGQHYSVVHVTGYIKNWPPAGKSLCKHISLYI